MGKPVSFASLNLLNLQAPGRAFYRSRYSQQEYAAKIAWTAAMLRDLDADVIGFQELWSAECLEEAFDEAGLDDDYERVYLRDDPAQGWYGIAVAAAVRRPWVVRAKTLIKDVPEDCVLTKLDYDDGEDDEVEVRIDRFARTVLKLTIGRDDDPSVPDISVFCAHLKAKVPSRVKGVPSRHQGALGSAVSTIRRTAEAAALRVVLTDETKHTRRPVVLLGDLNDDPRSNTLAVLTEQPTLATRARGRDTALYSSLDMQQLNSFRDVYYTHEFNGVRDSLDHVLVSKEFFRGTRGRGWKFDRARVINDYLEDADGPASDHGAIVAHFVPA